MAAGHALLSPGVTCRLIDRFRQGDHHGSTRPQITLPYTVTSREREALALAAAGKTNHEIAEQLHIAIGTAKTHVARLLAKLEARDRVRTGHPRSRHEKFLINPHPTGPQPGAVTWGEMVEARMLAEFRARNVTVQRMRPAIAKLRDEFGRYPLAHSRPFLDVDGREPARFVHQALGLE